MEQGLQTLNAEERLALWSERIKTCRSSGMSVRTWCQENGLSEKTYYYWQRRMFCLLSDQQPTFTEVQVQRVLPGDIAVTVRMGEVEADIHNGADKVTIEQVLSVLKSC